MTNSKDESQKRTPPYVPYSTLRNFFLDHKQGLPNRLDLKLLSKMGGTLRQQLLQALKYFDLVDADNMVSPELHKLVTLNETERKAYLAEMVKKGYPFIFKSSGFDLMKTSDSDFRKQFENAGAGGETVRKSTSFFLQLCKDAGIQVSPFIQQPKRRGGKSSRSNGPQQVKGDKPPKPSEPVSGELKSPANSAQAVIDLVNFFEQVAKWPAQDKKMVLDVADALIKKARG